MSAATEGIVVLCTAGSEDEGDRIARMAVETRLAACVSLLPAIRSIYRWQGKVVEDAEVLLIMKTHAGRFEELRDAIRKAHSYDVPEVLALQACAIDADYGAWLGAALDMSGDGGNQ